MRFQQHDLGYPLLAQRHEDGTRRTAGAEYDGSPEARGPAWRVLVEIAEKAHIVGVEPMDPAIGLAHQGIGRADGPRQRIDAVAEGENRLLVRNGDIAADELAPPQPLDEGGQGIGGDIDRLVAAVDAVLGQPAAMDQRRAGMLDRVADDEGFFHVNH